MPPIHLSRTLAFLLLATLFPQPLSAEDTTLIDKLLDLRAPAIDWRTTFAARAPSLPPGASDDDLLDYWSNDEARPPSEKPLPDDKTRQRLLDIALRRPASIRKLLPVLPDTPDAHDRLKALYDKAAATEPDAEWREVVRTLLMTSGPHFRDDLIAAAKAPPADGDEWAYREDDSPLAALAKLDWPAAEPILRERQRDPNPEVAARAVVIEYRHLVAAAAADDAAAQRPAAEKLRGRLRAIAVDRAAPPLARNAACTALLSSAWPGRDDWYLALFANPALRDVRTDGLLMEPLRRPVARDPDHWVPIVARLVADKDRATHDAAVSCLIQFQLQDARADALRPLIPWLADPTWSSARDRLRLIQSLDRVTIPEAIPGLIKVVREESGFERAGAAAALAHHRARPEQVGPALRQALADEPDEHHKREVVRAMLACGVLDDAEIVTSIEAAARQVSNPSLGAILRYEVSDRPGIAAKLIARADALAERDPATADTLRVTVGAWPDPAVDLDIAKRLAAGPLDEAELQNAAARAALLRKHAAAPLRDLAAKGGARGGLAAGLLADAAVSEQVMAGDDAAAQAAMFAAARLARAPLPIAAAAKLMGSADARVARAAELYLISEDGPDARRAILARHPGEAFIVGARQDFDGAQDAFGEQGRDVEGLRDQVRRGGPGGCDEALTLTSHEHQQSITVRIRRGAAAATAAGDTADLTIDDGGGRRRSRVLTADELRRLRAFVADNRVNELPPLETRVLDGVHYSYFHLTRNGGCRVYMNNPGWDESGGTVYVRLVALFQRLAGAAAAPGQYDALEKIPGAEVVFSNDERPAVAVWKAAAGVRRPPRRRARHGRLLVRAGRRPARRQGRPAARLARQLERRHRVGRRGGGGGGQRPPAGPVHRRGGGGGGRERRTPARPAAQTGADRPAVEGQRRPRFVLARRPVRQGGRRPVALAQGRAAAARDHRFARVRAPARHARRQMGDRDRVDPNSV